MKEEVIIIGGGIAGLTAAYTLKQHGLDPLILEAGNRLGGRIYTKSSSKQQFELGATWVFEDEVLKQLISTLGLELYPQYLKGDALIKYDPSTAIQRSATNLLTSGAIYHKVHGGTGAIIQALADQLEADRIRFQSKVTELVFEKETISLTMEDGSILKASKVITTVPPKTISDQIMISPTLDDSHLMQATHTWMGDSSKFTVVLDKDYWKIHNLSGFVYSNYGLIREIQDHSADDGSRFALLGFIEPMGSLTNHFEERKQVVFQELKELFGIHEESILAYDDFLWSEYFVDKQHKNYNTELLPHQNNGHPFFRQAHFNNRLFFAGAETSPVNPGYMEGAVRSAYHAVGLLLNQG